MQGLQRMSALDVPIYITETGIADAAGDRRPLWLETYIPEVERAVRDGMDVRGLMYWTLVDNFEVSNWSPRVMLYIIARSALASIQSAEVLPVCWAWSTLLAAKSWVSTIKFMLSPVLLLSCGKQTVCAVLSLACGALA